MPFMGKHYLTNLYHNIISDLRRWCQAWTAWKGRVSVRLPSRQQGDDENVPGPAVMAAGPESNTLIKATLYPLSFNAAWAAARRATGTRKGEQET